MKAIIFDLDGTLLDSVFQHTLAWQRACAEYDLIVPAYEIQRRIGMSGKLLAQGVARVRDRNVGAELLKKLEDRHAALFREMQASCRALPGAVALIEFLRKSEIAHGIATTGKRGEAPDALKAFALDARTVFIDGSATERAKPDPDLFVECQSQLQVEKSECLVVGDSVWDIHAARRAGILSVGLLTGGFGEQELYNAGAMRVYRDAEQLHLSIDELGILA